MATVELDAGEFRYSEYGDLSAPALVLLHGLPRDRSTWAGVAPELAAAGYRVIAPDLRGHGESPRTSAYSLELMRDDVLQLADRLGLDRFTLGGHSMGGNVSILFAERYPSRLNGLIVVDVAPPDGSGDWDPGPRPDADLPYDWNVVPAIFAQLRDPDPAWWAELSAITAPALVIGGGAASPVPQHLLAKATELMPDAALVTVEGAGHAVHQTRPEDFLTAVIPFLRGIH